MGTLRLVSCLFGLALLTACSSHGANTANATLTPSPSTSGIVLVGLSGVEANITLVRTDGSVVATMSGTPVGDEHAIGAFLVMAKDGTGREWTVDRSGTIKQVADAAAKLLTPNVGSVLVLSSTSAIVGCDRGANGDCNAEAIDLTTGVVRPLLTVANSAPPMEFGNSLKVLDVSSDMNTVWFREVTGATATKLAIVAVDLTTGKLTTHALPAALLDEQDLAISRDGRWVAGQEDAGTNSTHLAIRHLHVVSLATGLDSDVQGSAVYVLGQRPASIQFAPNGSSVEWWGGVDNGSIEWRVNTSPIGGSGKTIYPANDPNDPNGINSVSWLDGSTLIVLHSGTSAVRADNGSATPMQVGIDVLLGVLTPTQVT
jgi:hypothetical protein